jgi:hypothetical protein
MHPLSPPPNTILDVDDVAALRRVQGELEEGVRYDLVGAPDARGSFVLAPLFRHEGARVATIQRAI